ncbi:hypothetical protein [Nostoc sp.]|uniref:hypothetical protein n=1 Tax=Nostoc sp. TaxID=1180 RepID=UPI002FF7D884
MHNHSFLSVEYAFWHISSERSRQAQILTEAVGRTNAIKYSKQGNSSSFRISK